MRIFNGKKGAERILSDLKKRISKEKLKPKLAVILVGQDKTSKLYIKLKRRAAKKIGIKLVLYKFKRNVVDEDKSSSPPLRCDARVVEEDKSSSLPFANARVVEEDKSSSLPFANARVKEEKIIQKIKNLNNNSSVHGVIVQLPLPKKFNPNRIIGTINPKKDVDGFRKNSCFSPVLLSAILFSMKRATKIFKKKKIVALVNSKILGETFKLFLKKEGIKIDYILTKKHLSFEIKKVRDKLKRADALVAVLGRPGFIKGDMIKDKAILIDAGITKIGPKKVVGDVDRESVKEKASFLTPVPGGIGPLTVALLLKNTYLAAKNYGKHS